MWLQISCFLIIHWSLWHWSLWQLIKDVIEKRNHPHKSLREREIVLDPPWEDTALLHPRDCLLFANQTLLLFHTSKKRNTSPTIKICEQNLELVKPNDAKETNVVSLCLKWASLSCAWFPSLNTFAICYLAARWWSTFQFCKSANFQVLTKMLCTDQFSNLVLSRANWYPHKNTEEIWPVKNDEGWKFIYLLRRADPTWRWVR